MTSHLGMMCVFSACVGVVFAVLLRDDTRAQLRLAIQIFGALVLSAYAVGWLMYAAFR